MSFQVPAMELPRCCQGATKDFKELPRCYKRAVKELPGSCQETDKEISWRYQGAFMAMQ